MDVSLHGVRRAGILLHITSLPSPFSQGVCGAEALAFIDRLAATGIRVWQFLPLGPTHGHGSPYETLSTFAGNPELIDVRPLASAGWLSDALLAQVIAGMLPASVARAKAAQYFFDTVLPNDAELRLTWDAFMQKHRPWLHDFACFMAIKDAHQGKGWWQWRKPWKQYSEQTLQQAEHDFPQEVSRIYFEQFMFERQWQTIKNHAQKRGVILFGDLPIYVAHDSADVWSHHELFTLNDDGNCTHVAGVPPDYFSTTGQRWGNPLYHWEVMAKDNFSWWQDRVRHQLLRMDWMRIDHFRGLEAYWAIPAGESNGKKGVWLPAPGAALLEALQQSLDSLPLIAEDLGLITEPVTALRQRFGLSGMKILHFAFGGDDDNPYLPNNHDQDSVVYTGTHDNDTTVGWYAQAEPHVRSHVKKLFSCEDDEIADALMNAALASVAELAIVPMQDVLSLPTTARFNTPGTIKNNWCWRMNTKQAEDAACWAKVKAMVALHQR